MPDVIATPARRQPPRAAYALPTLFTAGNIFLGYLSILRSFQGAILAGSNPNLAASHFEMAAKSIGLAVVLDGLDGRIARMTNTTSEFGKEIDSLSDVISFGIAPAILAFACGVQFVDLGSWTGITEHINRAGKFISFLFLLCGAARLARFNVQKNPTPKNPGRPHRKYFVGLPIPAAAAMVAAVVYSFDSYPVTSWWISLVWIFLLGLLSFLMVSTWRYYSFKDLNLLHPRSPLSIIVLGGLITLIWFYSQPVLLILAACYVGSGIVTRIGGSVRRHLRPPTPPQPQQAPEHQIG